MTHKSLIALLQIWLDEHPYDETTGAGSIGVEFSGSAVTSPSPGGQNIYQVPANNRSARLVAANRELQWQDVYFRGYYELTVSQAKVDARYFGIPSLVQRLPYEISLANFTVHAGANALQRPVGGGVVESGALKGGIVKMTNLTNNTMDGSYLVTNLASFGYGQGPRGS